VAAIEHHDTRRTRQRRGEETQVTDPSRYDDTGGIPRWAKVVGIVALVVALLVVVMVLMGGTGGHGPQRHGGAGGVTPSPVVTASAGVSGHTPPSGVPTPG
jgi:hypothetical protein